MISHQIITRGSMGANTAKAIESYYQDSKDDYYSKDNQPSMWQGKLAEELGLIGEVKKENFIQLMSGVSPDHRVLRDNKYNKKNAQERMAIDLTFSAPKSISIESLVNKNEDVLKAHEEAVTKTLELIEKKANTRYKENGVSHTVNTQNLAIAKFRHETNRNNDPQLHTHALILNITKRDDGKYRALHNDSIVKTTKEFTKIYQGFLAKELKEQGFKLRITKDGFELAHINENQIKAFSSRSQEIEKELEKEGLSRATASTAKKQKITLSTRQRKQDKDIIQIRNKWAKDAHKVGIKPFSIKKDIKVDKNINKYQKIDTVKEHKDSTSHENFISKQMFSSFENSFNQSLKDTYLNQAEILNEQERINPTGLKFDEYRSRSSTRQEADFTRGLSEFKSKSSSTNFKRQDNKRNITRSTEKRKQQPTYTHNRYFDNTKISRDGINKDFFSSTRYSAPNFGEHNTKRTETVSDYMRTMPSIALADPNRFNRVLLPVDKKVFFYDKRTSDFVGLSGSENSTGSNAGVKEKDKNLEQDQESLDDIFTYHLVDNDIKDKWKDKLESLNEDDINEDITLFESKEELKEFVIEHLTDKSHIISNKELEKQLIEKGLGIISFDDIQETISEMIDQKQIIATDQLYNLNGELLTENGILNKLELPTGDYDLQKIIKNNKISEVEKMYTTPQAYEQDQDIITLLNRSKKEKNCDSAYDEITDVKAKLDNTTLNEGQKKCSEMILTSDDGVIGIQGFAGTGKSYLLNQTKNILEESDKEKKMFFVAPYSSQVKNLEADGLEANTLAKFLKSNKLQKDLDKNSVVVVDESGVINSKQMKELLILREAVGFQVVLVGDTSQTKAVEAGSPFELLQQNGLKIEKMTDIQRQKRESLKEAVVSAVNDDMNESISNLENVYEVKDAEERYNEIAEAYINLEDEDREKTLIVSGTNEARTDINNLIREKLNIQNKGIDYSNLENKDLTTAQKKLSHFYEEGDVIEFFKDDKNSNAKKGINYTVVDTDKINNKIIVSEDGNHNIEINPKMSSKNFSVYKESIIEISKGDKIRVTKTDNEKNLASGDIFEIESISKDTGIAIGKDKNGEIFEFNKNNKQHITYSYAMTVHSAQGLTYDNVIADLNTKSLTLSKETFYVAISRARNNAFIFTENEQDLPNAVKRSSFKSNAVSLFNKNVSVKDEIYDSINPDQKTENNYNFEKPSEKEDNIKESTQFTKEEYKMPNQQENIVNQFNEMSNEKGYRVKTNNIDETILMTISDKNTKNSTHTLDISKDGDIQMIDSNNESYFYNKDKTQVNEVFEQISKNIFSLDRMEKATESLKEQVEASGYTTSYLSPSYDRDEIMIENDEPELVINNEVNDSTYTVKVRMTENDEVMFDIETRKLDSFNREREIFTISEEEVNHSIELDREKFKYHLEAKELLNGVENKHFTNHINEIKTSKIHKLPHDYDLSLKAENEEIYSRKNNLEDATTKLKANDMSKLHKVHPEIIESFIANKSQFDEIELKSENLIEQSSVKKENSLELDS